MTLLITQISPIYCHFAFYYPNIFSGTCSRVVYIHIFSSTREVMYTYMYVCMYVCELVHVDLTVSMLHNYVRMLTSSG